MFINFSRLYLSFLPLFLEVASTVPPIAVSGAPMVAAVSSLDELLRSLSWSVSLFPTSDVSSSFLSSALSLSSSVSDSPFSLLSSSSVSLASDLAEAEVFFVSVNCWYYPATETRIKPS